MGHEQCFVQTGMVLEQQKSSDDAISKMVDGSTIDNGHLSLKVPNVKFDFDVFVDNSPLGFQH